MDNCSEAFVATRTPRICLRRHQVLASWHTLKSRNLPLLHSIQSSSKPQEEWLRDSIMGTIPRGKSGQPAPICGGLEGGAYQKLSYFGLVEITGDDIRFDRLEQD